MAVTTRLLVAVAILIVSCRACMDITDYFGTLSSAYEIKSFSLLSISTSCQCCALCHQDAACKSLSFNQLTNRCTLYNTVGSYADFARERQAEHNTQFFIMPSRSLTDEFCRSDSDCIARDDLCRGRICTTDTTITCRDLYDRNAALPDHRYWGALEGRQHSLYCRMEAGFEGATLLLAFQKDAAAPWSYENLLDKPNGSPDESQDFSILKHADLIRDRRSSSEFRFWIIAKKYGSNPEFQQNFTASRSLSLTGSDRILLSSGKYSAVPEVNYDDRYLVFPHITSDCNALYSTGNYDCNDRRSLVKAVGRPWWPTSNMERDSIVLYITE